MENLYLPAEPDWNKLTLSDDFLFGYAMQNLNICKEFLEILLNTKIAEIHHLRQQDKIKLSPTSRAVYLDVKLFADGRIINVEMQTTNKKDLTLRSRYYQSTTDSRLLKQGQPFSDLPELLTIFICTFDWFKKDKPLYTVRNTVKELDNQEFNDKRKILLYNTNAYKNAMTIEQKDLLNFISGGKTTSVRGKNFSNLITNLKAEESFKEEYMDYYLKQNELRAEALREGIAQGIAQQKAEDEKLLAKTVAQKDALLSSKDALINSKDAENARLNDRIAQLEALLAQK